MPATTAVIANLKGEVGESTTTVKNANQLVEMLYEPASNTVSERKSSIF